MYVSSTVTYIVLDLECIFILSNFIALILFISAFPLDNWKPICSRQFAFDAVNKPNLFCGIAGWFTVFPSNSMNKCPNI